MKKFVCSVLSVCLLLCAAVVPSYAAGENVVTADVSYTENLITAVYTNNMAYGSNIMVYLMKEGKTPTENFEDVTRVAEVFCKAGGSATVTFTIAEDLLVPGGDKDAKGANYQITAVSGGAKPTTVQSAAFYIFTTSETDDILQKINDADKDTIVGVIQTNLSTMFNLPTNIDADYVYEMRTDDYEDGKFQTLDDVDAALKAAELLKTVNASTVDTMKTNIGSNADALGLTLDDYYNAVADAAAADMVTRIGAAKPYSLTDFRTMFEEATAVAFLNANNDDQTGLLKLDEFFKAYQKTIGLTDAEMASYAKKNAATFAQQFNEYDVTTKAQIAEKFRAALTAVPDAESGGGNNGGTGGGTGGGASSIGRPGGSTGGATYPSAVPGGTTATNNRFSDVNSSFWAYEPIEALAEAGILSGYPNGTFDSGRLVTREEYTKVLVTAFGLQADAEAEINFADVASERWSSDVIRTAASLNVVNGVGDNRFAPEASITRQDAAVMMSRVLESKGITLKGNPTSVTFVDGETVSDYAQDAVELLASYQVLNGFGDGTFRPNDLLTRAEMAKIIYTVINLK